MNTSTSTANDVSTFIQDSLIDRSEQLHKFPQMCEPVTIEKGNGKTCYMVKYNRTDVPVATLTEGVTPTETPFTISRQSVTVDQWGMYITLTDVIQLTTKHPVLSEALDLVADAIARCQDYNIAEVANRSTNKQYWDGTRATRGAVTSTDVFKAAVCNKARADLENAGAPNRKGDYYIALTDPSVMADVINETTAVGSFSAMAQMQDKDALMKGHVMNWLGFEWVKSNFLPAFTRIATVSPSAATTGGSLPNATVYYKVTRKSTSRGFEEAIQVEGSTAMGANTRLPFTFPSTAGYVYNLYSGSVTGDANLFLTASNQAPSSTYNLDVTPTSGDAPPATPAASVTVHPIYIFALKAIDNVDLAGAMKGGVTKQDNTDSDPLAQRRKVSSSYMSKSGIRDTDRLKVIELASNF